MNRHIFQYFVRLYLKGAEIPLTLVGAANEMLQEAEDLFQVDPTAFCYRLLYSNLSGMIVGVILSSLGPSLVCHLSAVVRGDARAVVQEYERMRPPWISDSAWDVLVAARQPLALAAL